MMMMMMMTDKDLTKQQQIAENEMLQIKNKFWNLYRIVATNLTHNS